MIKFFNSPFSVIWSHSSWKQTQLIRPRNFVSPSGKRTSVSKLNVIGSEDYELTKPWSYCVFRACDQAHPWTFLTLIIQKVFGWIARIHWKGVKSKELWGPGVRPRTRIMPTVQSPLIKHGTMIRIVTEIAVTFPLFFVQIRIPVSGFVSAIVDGKYFLITKEIQGFRRIRERWE